MNTQEIKIPQPDEISKREKEDAMGAYFMMFAAWGVGLPLPVLNLIAAFIYFMINKKSSRFVAFHSLQSLLSQLPVTAANLSVIVWLFRIIFAGDWYFPSSFFGLLVFMILLNLLYLVISIISLTKAKKGQFYYMPFFGRLAFSRFYGPNAVELVKPTEPNKPPEGF